MASQALSLLFVAAIVLVSLAWDFAVQYPAAAISIVSFAVFAVTSLAMSRAKRRDELMRDEHVPSMNPTEYEQFTARLLERAGWSVKHCGRTGDQGVDLVATLRGFHAAIQVKLWNQRVGNSAVQEVCTGRAMYHATICVVVAPHGYTTSARALAARNGCLLLHHSELGNLERLARIPAP